MALELLREEALTVFSLQGSIGLSLMITSANMKGTEARLKKGCKQTQTYFDILSADRQHPGEELIT